MKQIITQTKTRIEKSVEGLRAELAKLRTGRASLAILDEVRVECYGSLMPLNQVATLNIPEPRLITIQPWDAGVIPAIEKGIQKAQLGLNPANDGKMIRLPLPPLTEERRKELVKVVRRIGEEHKVAIRNARRDALEACKQAEKTEHLSEDDEKRAEQEIQKYIDSGIKQVDEAMAHKEKEILTV
ncbi:MAG: ribosome recycling factor [Deltaproteobacteria bacterium]|nr:ribosome recycling factor [Deltaproteobacteria bacterium]